MGKKMIKCKVCGAEIAKSAKTCPQCGAKQHQAVGVACAIIIVITIFACIGILAGGGDEPKLVTSNPATSSSPAPTDQPLVFGVGDVAELNDIQVSLTSVEESSGSQYNKPSDGNVFVLCEFTIENNSESEIAVSSLMSFDAYVDDFSTNLSLSALLEKGNKQQLDGSIAAGKKMAGVVGYEVSKDWSELEIRFTPSFWSGKDITFSAPNSSK